MAEEMNEMEELEDEIIELVDEEGKVLRFKLLDVTEYKGEKYTLLIAAEPNEEIDEDEVVIFRLNEEEEMLEPIEDEALLDEVYDFYCSETEDPEEFVSFFITIARIDQEPTEEPTVEPTVEPTPVPTEEVTPTEEEPLPDDPD